ncbi:MAG: hypothetical protein AVDCRST_MAG59-685, partial [uncultured Thermomicrobiales bacterium]
AATGACQGWRPASLREKSPGRGSTVGGWEPAPPRRPILPHRGGRAGRWCGSNRSARGAADGLPPFRRRCRNHGARRLRPAGAARRHPARRADGDLRQGLLAGRERRRLHRHLGVRRGPDAGRLRQRRRAGPRRQGHPPGGGRRGWGGGRRPPRRVRHLPALLERRLAPGRADAQGFLRFRLLVAGGGGV